MGKYRLSNQANIDLDAIAEYLGQRSSASAERVLDALFDAFQLLGASPLLGTLREDLRPNLRVFSAKKPAAQYLIFYYPRSGGIEVSTVVHGARDYLGMFRRGQRD
jgi:toxin ParE1/3/4